MFHKRNSIYFKSLLAHGCAKPRRAAEPECLLQTADPCVAQPSSVSASKTKVTFQTAHTVTVNLAVNHRRGSKNDHTHLLTRIDDSTKQRN